MYAYELLPKLKYLTLAGQNSEGELEWIGTDEQWDKVERETKRSPFENDAEEDLEIEAVKEDEAKNKKYV